MSRQLAGLVPDRADATVIGGLALLTAGIARLSVAWAMIVAGALIFALGLASVIRTIGRG